MIMYSMYTGIAARKNMETRDSGKALKNWKSICRTYIGSITYYKTSTNCVSEIYLI